MHGTSEAGTPPPGLLAPLQHPVRAERPAQEDATARQRPQALAGSGSAQTVDNRSEDFSEARVVGGEPLLGAQEEAVDLGASAQRQIEDHLTLRVRRVLGRSKCVRAR